MIRLLCLLLCSAELLDEPPSRQVDLLKFISELHNLEWSDVNVETVEKHLGAPLTLVEAKIPSDSVYAGGSCDASVYATGKFSEGVVRLEFRKSVDPHGKCVVFLYSARIEMTARGREVEELRLLTVCALQANGKTCDSGVPEYRWRSNDSRTLFSLALSAESDLSDNSTRLSVWLRHIPVVPTSVDDLPFHRGFICPAPGSAAVR